MQKYIVSNKDAGQTLEKFVKKVLKDAPLSIIYKLFRKKDVKVNGHWQDLKYVVSEGEEISIYLKDEQLEEFRKKQEVTNFDKLSSWIIYEDENVILINKPRGVLVQKADESDVALDTMVISYLVGKGEYDPNKDFGYVPAPAHRLDRNTAGIIIFGKNLPTLQYLSSIMQDKEKIEKRYLTLVKGHIDSEGEITLPLIKKQTHVDVDYKNGKEAITRYRLVKYVGDYSFVEIQLLTGRTHQIRVHMSKSGYPVVGDAKYGDFKLNNEIEEKYHFKNQFLVAYKLSFNNVDGPLKKLNKKEFEIELPIDCLDLIKNLEHN